jgi:hypothetical protein
MMAAAARVDLKREWIEIEEEEEEEKRGLFFIFPICRIVVLTVPMRAACGESIILSNGAVWWPCLLRYAICDTSRTNRKTARAMILLIHLEVDFDCHLRTPRRAQARRRLCFGFFGPNPAILVKKHEHFGVDSIYPPFWRWILSDSSCQISFYALRFTRSQQRGKRQKDFST